jgi:hypothetical protein
MGLSQEVGNSEEVLLHSFHFKDRPKPMMKVPILKENVIVFSLPFHFKDRPKPMMKVPILKENVIVFSLPPYEL